MSDRPYTELRASSAFSFLDSSALPEDLIYHAAAQELAAMAIVDANGVYGAPRFYTAAKKVGIKAIMGAEVRLEPPTHLHEAGTIKEQHLSLLVENREGYKNLCKLLTAGALHRPKGGPPRPGGQGRGDRARRRRLPPPGRGEHRQ